MERFVLVRVEIQEDKEKRKCHRELANFRKVNTCPSSVELSNCCNFIGLSTIFVWYNTIRLYCNSLSQRESHQTSMLFLDKSHLKIIIIKQEYFILSLIISIVTLYEYKLMDNKIERKRSEIRIQRRKLRQTFCQQDNSKPMVWIQS